MKIKVTFFTLLLIIGLSTTTTTWAWDIDSDNDGLADAWEILYFGNLDQGADDDSENDGLRNWEEYVFSTNPTINDNVVINPSFDSGMTGWTSYGSGGDVEIVQEGMEDNAALHIINTDGSPESQIGVLQNHAIEPTASPLYFTYWVKPVQIENNALVTMDVGVHYVGDNPNSFQYIYGGLQATTDDLNKWVRKSLLFRPERPVDKIRVILLNYYGLSDAYYDRVCVAKLPQPSDITISNNQVLLTLSSLGDVKSLTSIENPAKEQIKEKNPISGVRFLDGGKAISCKIDHIGDNQYILSYKTDTSISNSKVTLEIIPKENYFLFKIIEVKNAQDLEAIDLFQIYPFHIPQRNEEKEWAIGADDTELFLNALSLNIETLAGVYGSRYICRSYYGLKPNEEAPFVDAMGALVTVPKAQYDDLFENVAKDPEYSIPNFILNDGNWLRKSGQLKESYLFATITKNNAQEIVDYAKRGRFKQVVAIEPVLYGHYNRPKPWQFTGGLTELQGAMARFTDAGINVGIHSHFNEVQPYEGDEPLVDFQNGSNLKEALFNQQVGTLAQDIGEGNGISIAIVPLTPGDLSENPIFRHYYLGKGIEGGIWGKEFLIDNEIITFTNYPGSGNVLNNCIRGEYTTTIRPHTSGTPVYQVPKMGYCYFFINPNNTEIVEHSLNSFIAFATNIDGRGHAATMLYFDGGSFVDMPGLPDPRKPYSAYSMEIHPSLAIEHKYGVLPYINAIKENYPPDAMPLLQFAEPAPSFGWFYERRLATWDGPVFKSKDFTNQYKVKSILESSPYNIRRGELGWWKFHGALLSDGSFDNDAVTEDDLDYVMSKSWALDTSVGLQLSEGPGSNYTYLNHEYLLHLFDKVALYNQFIADIDEGNIATPADIKSYLANADNEGELKKINEQFYLVKKKVSQAYVSAGANTVSIDNPFGTQKVVVEIRPRFDYYPFADACHLAITDFSGANSSWVTRTSSNDITYSLNNGAITVTNSGDNIGGCEITIPGVYNLTNKRGVGIKIKGDGKNELITARLEARGEYGIRDFKFLADFSNTKEIILPDPTGDVGDYVDGCRVDWQGDTMMSRNWDFDYGSDEGTTVKIYINNIKPHTTSSIQLFALKALQEKGQSPLGNPSITTGYKTIAFRGITLYANDTDAHILQYNGNTGDYVLYTSNYKKVGRGHIDNDLIFIKPGRNIIRFNSSQQEGYSTRADLRISIYGDSKGDINGDGVATEADIDPFVKVISGYDLQPRNIYAADINGDGYSNAFDIDYFSRLIPKNQKKIVQAPKGGRKQGLIKTP